MHGDLEARSDEFEEPENVKQDLTNIDRKYHSDEIRKRAMGEKAAKARGSQ